MDQNQVVPKVGEDVSHLMSNSAQPQVGQDVTHLMNQQNNQGGMLDWFTRPLDQGRLAKQAGFTADILDQPSNEPPSTIPFTGGATWKGLGAGLVQGAGNVMSGFTSPMNLGLMALSSGEGAAARMGYQDVAQGLSGARRLAGAGVTAQGAYHGYNALQRGDTTGALMSIPEMAMGGAMMDPRIAMQQQQPINQVKPEIPKAQTGETYTGQAPNLPKEFTYEPEKGFTIDPATGKVVEATRVNKPKEQWQLVGNTFKKVTEEQPEFSPEKEKVAQESGISPLRQDELAQKFGGKQEEPIDENDPSNQVQFARNAAGRVVVGVNVRRNAQELTTGYSQPLQAIMVREGLQNAIDAVEPLGEKGKVSAIFNRKDNYIKISDNGPGMDEAKLAKQLVDINETGKIGQTGAAGGKGVGSASYILGGKRFEIESVVDKGGEKIKYSMGGEPEELLDDEKGLDIKKTIVPKSTPTGTTFKTYLKENQDQYESRNMLQNIIDNSRDIKAELTSNRHGEEFKTLEEKNKFKPSTDDQIFYSGPLDENSDVTISLPKDTEFNKEGKSYANAKVLNKGIYQFQKGVSFSERMLNAPEDILVNIKPKVEEGSDEYPFPTSRDTMKDIPWDKLQKLIEEKLVKPGSDKTKTKLDQLYKAIEPVNIENTKYQTAFFDPGDRLTPKEKLAFQNSPVIKGFTKAADDFLSEITSHLSTKENERIERIGVVLDPNLHGVHIPNPLTGKSTILINPFENIARKNPEQAAFNNAVTVLHESAHIGNVSPAGETPPLDLSEINDPRVGQFLQSYINHTITSTGMDMGHSIDFIKRLGDIYARTGPKAFFDFADKIKSIFEQGTSQPTNTKPEFELTNGKWTVKQPTESTTRGEPGQYSPEVQNLLSIYQESRGRTPTTEDLLSPTGIKSKVTRPGEGDISGSNQANDERTITQQAIGKLTDALKSVEPLREKQEGMYSEERSARVRSGLGEFQKNPTVEGFAKGKQQLAGDYEKVPGRSFDLEPNETNALMRSIAFSDRLSPFEKFRAASSILDLMDGRVLQRNEISTLGKQFGREFGQVLELHAGIPIKLAQVQDIANAMKSMRASINFHAPLRQGLPLIYRDEFWKAFGPMFRSRFSENYFDSFQQGLKDRRPGEIAGYVTSQKGEKIPLSYSEFAQEAGLQLTDKFDREEQFASKLAEKVPGVKGSQNAYVAFLNSLRSDTFDSLLDQFKASEQGDVNLGVAKKIAKFVNDATGRGTLPDFTKHGININLNKMGNELNLLLFSPRLIASRLAMLNPLYYQQFPAGLRQQAIKAQLSVAGAGLIIDGLVYGYAKSVGGHPSVSANPINTDFGKTRVGNDRFSAYGGFQSDLVAAARLIAGKETSSQTGKTWDLTQQGYRQPTRMDVLANFGRSKLSPAASLAVDMLKGTDYQGNKINVPRDVAEQFIPIYLEDLYKVWKDNPSLLPPAMTVGGFGGAVETYPPRQQKMPFNLNLGMGQFGSGNQNTTTPFGLK